MVTFKFDKAKQVIKGEGINIRAEDGIVMLNDKNPRDKKAIKFLREHKWNKANPPKGAGKFEEVETGSEDESHSLDSLLGLSDAQLRKIAGGAPELGNLTRGKLITMILDKEEE
jgi:hypothetical protein